jgi:hypothetical protein
MSGPKVIRVRTRQERIDTCRLAIAAVDHALAERLRFMDRHMIPADESCTHFAARRDELLKQLEDDQFAVVERSADALTRAIRSDLHNQVAMQAAREAQERRRKRSVRFGAEALLARCRESAAELPPECARILEEAAAGGALEDALVQKALSQASSALTSIAMTSTKASDRQQHLASALSDPAQSRSPNDADYVKAAEAALADPRFEKLAAQLVELDGLGHAAADEFQHRLDLALKADRDGELGKRDLLIGSLELEVAPALKLARLGGELQYAISAVAAAAEATGDTTVCRDDLASAHAAVEQGDFTLANSHLERAKAQRAAASLVRAAQASRAAILEGLKELGYEVREGMTTHWAENKQVVVRHAAKPGIALELAGTLDGGRLQARMVALSGSTRNPHADKQVEEKWCGELDLLRQYVAKMGGDITIERAVAAGTVPLKAVADDRYEEDERQRLVQQQRSR